MNIRVQLLGMTIGVLSAGLQISPAMSQECIGDCNNDLKVTVDEIIKGVNIALGNQQIDACPSFDVNSDGTVTVDELIMAVNAALNGCTASLTPTVTEASPTPTAPATDTPTVEPTATVAIDTPTPGTTDTATPSTSETVTPITTDTAGVATDTPTPVTTDTTTPGTTETSTPEPATSVTAEPTESASETPTPTQTEEPTASATAQDTETPAPTSTPGGAANVPERAAGTIQNSSTAILIVPQVISALLGHTPTLGAGGAALGPIPFTCDAGGGEVTCDQVIPGPPPTIGPPVFTVVANNCVVNRAGGAQLTVNGTIVLTGQQGESCLQIPTTAQVQVQDFTAEAKGPNGSTTTASSSNLAGTLGTSCSSGSCACPYDTVTFQLTGSISLVSKDPMGTTLTSTDLTFGDNSDITMAIEQQSDTCVPEIYSLSVDGDMTLATGGTSLDATFSGYTVHDDATSGEDVVTLSGQIASSCFGGAVQFATEASLHLVSGDPCPQAGAVAVTFGGSPDLVRFTNGGGVQIDLGEDGTIDAIFGTCLDPRLLQCPAA